MRWVPPFNTILSMANRGRYATLIARQEALTSCMGAGTTWEMTMNLLLDKPHPILGVSMHHILMNIPSVSNPSKPLFNAIYQQWQSNNVVNFCFLPKHKSVTKTTIASLIPFLRDTWCMVYECFLHRGQIKTPFLKVRPHLKARVFSWRSWHHRLPGWGWWA